MRERFTLNAAEQAELDALRTRMEAEQYQDRAYENAIRARPRGGND